MGKDISRKELLSKLEEAIRSENLALFAGAGLSKPAGFFDWKNLLKEPAESIGLDIENEHDLLNVAQYYSNRKGRTEIEDIIIKSFPNTARPTVNHQLLATLPIYTYWTTNYDNLIEQALTEAHKKYNVKTEDNQLKLQTRDLDAVIYKMHGDYQMPSGAVITRNDYEEYGIKSRRLFKDVLEGNLLTKTFLFLGFGFSDPNFNSVLSKMRILLEGDTRSHYCIMKRPLENEYQIKDKYQYDVIKQELVIEDLFDSGIKVHLIDDFSEITNILQALSKKYKQKNIFISGSAVEYSPLSQKDATSFIQILSKKLVEKGFNIVNGFGLGVGTHVINGVSEYAYSHRDIRVGDHLTLMPFPQSGINDEKLRETWRMYREEMIEGCGIAIFIFGNKLMDDKVISADGVEEEFKIAKENELRLLPLNFTGWKAEELAKKEDINIDIKFENAEVTASKIVELIEKINKEEI